MIENRLGGRHLGGQEMLLNMSKPGFHRLPWCTGLCRCSWDGSLCLAESTAAEMGVAGRGC